MNKAYIFDYGGTIDTPGNHWGKVLWRIYQTLQVPVSEAQFREAYIYAERTLGSSPIIKPHYDFYQTLQAKITLQMQYLAISGYEDKVVMEAYRQTQQHTAYSRSILEKLRHDYPLVLVSNFYGNIHTVLHEFQLQGLFSHVIESADVGIRKPDPRIFTLAVHSLGLQPQETVVVGDSIKNDILPAKQAGCHTVWIQGEQWDNMPLDPTIPDDIIHNLGELLF
jgi:putative hydrolase of the HAD superfamily